MKNRTATVAMMIITAGLSLMWKLPFTPCDEGGEIVGGGQLETLFLSYACAIDLVMLDYNHSSKKPEIFNFDLNKNREILAARLK